MSGMSEEQIREGLSKGRTLIQEEWSSAADIAIIDKLIAEGFAASAGWQYSDNFQCERRRIRRADPAGGKAE